MSENKTILTTRRFELWWRKVQAWLAGQFNSMAKETTAQEIKELILEEVVENIHNMSESYEQLAEQTAQLTEDVQAIKEALSI